MTGNITGLTNRIKRLEAEHAEQRGTHLAICQEGPGDNRYFIHTQDGKKDISVDEYNRAELRVVLRYCGPLTPEKSSPDTSPCT